MFSIYSSIYSIYSKRLNQIWDQLLHDFCIFYFDYFLITNSFSKNESNFYQYNVRLTTFQNSGRTKISYIKETSILNFYCAKRVLRREEDEDCTCDGISDKTLPGILSLKREFKLKQDGVTPSSWIRNSRSMLLLWYSPTRKGGVS